MITLLLFSLEVFLTVMAWFHVHWSVAAILTWYLLRRMAQGAREAYLDIERDKARRLNDAYVAKLAAYHARVRDDAQ